jgi:hypothetical protein
LKTITDTTIYLSAAIIERLSQIDAGDQPVRIIWAACRSEQWPKGFNNAMFLQWITDAAKARKEAADRETHNRGENYSGGQKD